MKPFRIFIPVIFLFFSANLFSVTNAAVFDGESVSNLMKELTVMKPGGQKKAEGLFRDYLSFYGLRTQRVKNYGFFLSRGRKLFAVVAAPERVRYDAVILLLHGYQEHSGDLYEAAERFLDRGYAVALFDMPGHGLSEGNRGAIGDFSEYAAALEDFAAFLGKPVFFIGHSTACAAAIELLHSRPGVFQKTVFIAPLVRTSFWGLLNAVYPAGSAILKEVPRSFFDGSGDREYADYLAFMEKKDPLQVMSVPIGWVGALRNWNGRIEKYGKISGGVCVVQGDGDIVLDWKANLEIIRDKFAECEIHVIPGGKHILLHESRDRKEAVFSLILDYLER